MNPNEVSKARLIELFEAINQRVNNVEAELEHKDERIDHLETLLRQDDNPHTLPSKRPHTSSGDDYESKDDARTDGGTVDRNPGNEPA